MKRLLAITAIVMALTLPLSFAQDGKKEEDPKVDAESEKLVTFSLTMDEAIYITKLVGSQPTESGAFQLWRKLRKSIEDHE